MMQRRAFARLRNEGMMHYNRLQCNDDRPKMLTIKKSDPKSVLVHCRHCQGSYNRKYFHRHRHACHAEADSTSVKPMQGHLLNAQEKPAFLDLLEGFQQTTIGDLCRTDATIRAIGRHLWLKDCTKVDKTYEVRKSVIAHSGSSLCRVQGPS